MSAQKARLVADQIRGRQVEDALGILSTSSKRFARPLAKLVRSALANAEEKNAREKAGIDVDNLYVARILVDEGPSQWRIRPRAQPAPSPARPAIRSLLRSSGFAPTATT